MLRVLFLILVLLNLTAWLWWSQQAEVSRAGSVDISKQVALEKRLRGAEDLVLLSELPPALPVLTVSRRELPEIAETAGQREGRAEICTRLGPFAEQARLEEIEEVLRQQQLAFSRVDSEIVTGQRFWVMLPPSAEGLERQEISARLAEDGFETFVVGEGEFRNHLSLGYFGNRDNAEKQLAKLTEWRDKAFIRPLDVREAVVWLEVVPKSPEQAAKLTIMQQEEPSITLSGCAELAGRQ